MLNMSPAAGCRAVVADAIYEVKVDKIILACLQRLIGLGAFGMIHESALISSLTIHCVPMP